MQKAVKRSYFERYALSQLASRANTQSSEELYLLSAAEQVKLRTIRNTAYLKAGLAGALGVILLYVPYHIWGPTLFPITKISIPYLNFSLDLEIEFLVYSVFLVVIEILYLTFLNVKVVAKIVEACGCPPPDDPHHTTTLDALVAVGLEKKQKELELLGLNPYEGLSKWAVFTYQILLKLKAALSGFLMKLIVTKILGRYALRMLVDLAGIPVYAFWNIWGIRKIIREARVRVLAPPLIKRLSNQLYDELGQSEQFRKALNQTMQLIAFSKRDFHFNHYLLGLTLMQKFEVSPENLEMSSEEFLKQIVAYDREVELALSKLLVFGIIIDGRLSRREIKAIDRLRSAGVIPYSTEQIKVWTRNYFDGKGLEEFFTLKLK